MLISCNLCQKKFVVPDNAIKQTGRLVQCSACGNKWTQYPVNSNEIYKIKPKIPKKIRPKKNLYTEEYLKKKHGLTIGDPEKDLKNKKFLNDKKSNGFGFYSYISFLIIFFITIFGVLNLTKNELILNYPSTEKYIDYLYETTELIKLLFLEFIK
tara:strand:- start:785 stop:1249 length:465 start_codon:yes stop_codon:yes gene_type:complete